MADLLYPTRAVQNEDGRRSVHSLRARGPEYLESQDPVRRTQNTQYPILLSCIDLARTKKTFDLGNTLL